MRLPPRTILFTLVLGVVLVVISVLLQLTNVARLAAESAATECGMISQSILLQIGQALRERPGDPIAILKSDPRVPLVLQAATSHAPSIAFVAICDTNQVAILHTNPNELGHPIVGYPPLPRPVRLRDSLALLRTLGQKTFGYAVDTPLALDKRPFATIRVAIVDTFLRDRVGEAFRNGLLAAALQIALAFGVGVLLTMWGAGRIRQIESGVAALREGRFDNRIPESGADEFSRLARDLNLLSDQIQHERERRRGSEANIRPALELLGEGLMTLGADRHVVLVNEQAAKLMGVRAEDFRGRAVTDVLPENHPVKSLIEQLEQSEGSALSAALAGGTHVAIGHRIVGMNGSGGFLIEFKAARAQEELTSLVDQSRILTRLGQMALGVAHEIRNPLQTIRFALDALEDAPSLPGEEVARRVGVARGEVEHMHRAIDGFLTVAKLRKPDVTPFQVRELMERLREEVETQAIFAGIDLRFDTGCEGVILEADEQVLRQAIENLVKNAIQAKPSRDSMVAIACRSDETEVHILVRDTGPGIPPQNLERVRDLYFTTKEKQGGTGVGLALVQQAVDLHGGRLDIESEVGVGTTVTIHLPLRKHSIMSIETGQ